MSHHYRKNKCLLLPLYSQTDRPTDDRPCRRQHHSRFAFVVDLCVFLWICDLLFFVFVWSLRSLGGVPSFDLLNFMSNALKIMSRNIFGPEIWSFQCLVAFLPSSLARSPIAHPSVARSLARSLDRPSLTPRASLELD